jgi:hypothetical protein
VIHLNFDSFNLELGPNWIEALHDRWRLTIPCRSDARPAGVGSPEPTDPSVSPSSNIMLIVQTGLIGTRGGRPATPQANNLLVTFFISFGRPLHSVNCRPTAVV